MKAKRHYRDGSYNPTWPWEVPTAAAALTIGGNRTSNTSVSFDDIRISHDSTGWTAEADDSGHTWRGTADSNAGAVLALLADRIGLHAVITLKSEPDKDEAPLDAEAGKQ